MPRSWEHRLCLYCTYLIKIKNLKSTTIRSYASAIKFVLKTDGYEWEDDKVLLNILTKSCKMKNDKLKVRLPIQKGLLELILFRIQRKYSSQPYLEAMYITAYLLLYYGLLRVGEVANSIHSIKAVNIHEARNQNRLLLVLYSSKTHGQESPPQKINIGKKSLEIYNTANKFTYKSRLNELGKFCPVEWTKRYIQLRKPATSDSENFFILSDNSPLSSQFLRNLLRTKVKSMGLQPELYDTHSFRISRATDLFKAGVHIDDIKQLGRWKSNAVYTYLRHY